MRRLEYNENQGCFNLENVFSKNANTNGWFTLSPASKEDLCIRFIEMIDSFGGKPLPSEYMKIMFDIYSATQ